MLSLPIRGDDLTLGVAFGVARLAAGGITMVLEEGGFTTRVATRMADIMVISPQLRATGNHCSSMA